MIDFTKLKGDYYWDTYGNEGQQQAYAPNRTGATYAANTSPNKPSTATTSVQPVTTAPLAATTTPTATTGDTTMAQTYAPFTNYPSQWQTASDTLTGIAQNGNPVNYGGWYNQAKQTAQYDITDAIRQAVEQAGMGGMRWSSALGRTGQDIAGRTMADLAKQWTGMELGAQQQGIQNQLGAAGQLGTLGQQYAYLPMDVSNNMMNQGMQTLHQ